MPTFVQDPQMPSPSRPSPKPDPAPERHPVPNSAPVVWIAGLGGVVVILLLFLAIAI
jgi:hypothetical protein